MNAEAILARAEESLRAKMPKGFRFKRSECLARLGVLESYLRTEEALLQGFLETVSRSPKTHIEFPEPSPAPEAFCSAVPAAAPTSASAPALLSRARPGAKSRAVLAVAKRALAMGFRFKRDWECLDRISTLLTEENIRDAPRSDLQEYIARQVTQVTQDDPFPVAVLQKFLREVSNEPERWIEREA